MSLPQPASPRLSVLVRVRDEAPALRRLFARLRAQDIDRPYEVVVIDNESTDGSAEVARAFGARVVTCPRSMFGYGKALNWGIGLCRADLVVLLSAHAWPRDDDWLSRMVARIESSDAVALYCRQVPDRHVCLQERAKFKVFDAADYALDRARLLERCRTGEDVYKVCSFSNSAAIIRRDAASRFPFRDLPYAEDRAFVLDCVMGGHVIAYLAAAPVIYRQPVSARTFFEIGRACNVSKHLIRELASESIGMDLRRSELARKAARLAGKPVEISWRIVEALARDRSHLPRAARYVIVSSAMAMGCIKGELTWREYRQTVCHALPMWRTADEASIS
jgi:rhamnosyltransferase